ncbi:putative secreted protein (Por secretion system target) [Jejuia pallidilutea]|uniref:Putative secreted protein (Por secretion system target) n=1 Tax=Jejuia pallidilutea TaxID=504487 RepID=A0A362WZH0_9FLAO|nr:T9SS type A sorting domain-containing protein [Jejuia pallidilutea]PQV47893.1 putative secreted protein (Por secretion system target) [Jejuia pallidilutea]
MKQLLLFFSFALFLHTNTFAQCPNIDTDNDGVLDCIDPCPNMPTSKIGNLSFESDFIGWTIPQNTASFSINLETNNILHGEKSLYITAPNASNFETHSIYSEEFTLEEGVPYNFKIPVKRIGNIDGDALRWVLVDENGIYRHFNNYYSFTEDWTYISFENFLVDFSNFSSNKFRLRLEFGLSTTDMVVDKIEFYESSQIVDPAYLDMNADGNPDCVPFSSESHPDYDALVTFYNALNGDNWNNNTNWLDTNKPLSSWFGITETNGRVTRIHLPQNNLNGALPNNINNLSFLNSLILNTNAISGNIPITLTNLTNLNTLLLAVNNITGGIPAELGNMTSLSYLNLGDNPLGGTIPASIGNLTNLFYLDFRACNLSGEIPEEINNLTNLSQLFLFLNQISGEIPQNLNNLLNLEILQLSDNRLQGNIPDFTSLNLNYFNISNNNFQFGDIEDEFQSYQNNIAEFIYAPQKNVGNLYNEALEIGSSTTFNTNISGSQNTYNWYRLNADGSEGGFVASGESITVSITSAEDYKWFYYYLATSSIVSGLTLRSEFFKIDDLPSNHPDYNALIAVYNALDGPNWNEPWDITAPIKTWNNWDIGFDDTTNRVNYLSLSGNDKVGELPMEIGDLSGLKSLYVESSENINGSIPPEIGNLANLESIFLWYCDFSGEVPIEVLNLSNLKTVFIGNQKSGMLSLSNGIPSTISNLQNLEQLDLNGIPISGALPNELFNLPKLDYIVLSNCGLSGQLSPQFANINQVHLLNNNFEGAIPQEILNSSGNFMLNIRDNYFDFNDLEPLVQANNYTNLNYSPQRTKDIALDLEFAPGEDITLTIDDTRLNKEKNSKDIGDTYQWFKNNIAITDTNASSYTITNAQETDSGVYYCEITNTLVPDLIIKRANITLNIDAALSVKDEDGHMVKIYPNPASNHINIKLKSSDIVQMHLYDAQGRTVLSRVLKTKNTIIDISHLNAGIYILNVMMNNTIITNRIIKQ